VTAQQNLAFLGLGQMGTPIARLLLQHGRTVTLWNRDRSKAEALKSGNARMAASPQDAVANAAAVFTMLADDAATEAVLFGDANHKGFLDDLPPGATVSLGIKDTRLAAAAEAGVRMRLADYFADVLDRAKEAGFADEDWAVGQYRIAQSDAPLHAEKD
jgi:3-hydroxyisobutyrate dehydrogenase-like beta-hydroxyacid dehydrogenase